MLADAELAVSPHLQPEDRGVHLGDPAARRFLQRVLDALPVDVFVVDDDARIVAMNRRPSDPSDAALERALGKRFGDYVDCVNSTEAGCGRGKACGVCLIRGSVGRVIAGEEVLRQPVALTVHQGLETVGLKVILSAAPLEDGDRRLALVAVEQG